MKEPAGGGREMDADLETPQTEDSWTEETRGLPSLVES